MDEAVQVRLHALVHALCLPIRLRVIRGAHPQLNSSQCKQLFPQITGEHSVTIGNQRGRQLVQLVHMVQEGLGNREGCKWMAQWDEVSKLGIFVDNHQDSV